MHCAFLLFLSTDTCATGIYTLSLHDALPICFEVLRQIRAASRLPIVMLTARGDDMNRIIGLQIGADDYLPKPFNPLELVARINAVLRRARSGPDDSQSEEVVVVGDVEMDGRTRKV